MISTLDLVIGVTTGTVVTILIEEGINRIIRHGAKKAGTNPTVIRDIAVAMRVIAVLVIVTVILSLTGLASEFTTITISGIGALAVSLALQNTLSNILSGILMFHDGVIHLNDTVEYGSVKGKVVRLALRNTWIKMDSGKIAVISNSLLAPVHSSIILPQNVYQENTQSNKRNAAKKCVLISISQKCCVGKLGLCWVARFSFVPVVKEKVPCPVYEHLVLTIEGGVVHSSFG